MTVEPVRQGFSAAAIDLERLRSPVSEEQPAGESLRYEGTYDLIQEARREDDPSLPQGVWKTSLKKADWKEVASLCLAALEERSKDLHLAAWLLEAWLRQHGLPGLEAGFKVLTTLCEAFWDELYPPIEEGDLEARLAPFEWLNEKVTLELKRVPITEGGDREAPASTWLDWEDSIFSLEARAARAAGDTKSEAGDRATRSRVLAQVSLTSTGFYRRRAEELEGTAAALAGLDALLHERCGNEAPSLAGFREVLSEMDSFVARVLEERHETEPEVMPMVDSAEGPAAEVEGIRSAPGEEGEAVPAKLRIADRAEAYRLLSLAADYLMRTEPHSPAPYLVRRAINWGSMSLSDVLKEMLRNNADLATVYTLLGIRSADED